MTTDLRTPPVGSLDPKGISCAPRIEEGTIHVKRQLRHGSLGVPKSGKDRVVPIVPSLAVVLEAWRKKNPKAEPVAAPSRLRSLQGPRPGACQ
jgi:integrase